MNEYKCGTCGRVHMAPPPAMQANISAADRDKLSRRFGCGAPASSIAPATPEDTPVGCNLQPIIIPGAYD